MAWYYGVNDSELYGSNFSTVLADAPPPLDDTYDEDENEIVFPNEAKKLKKFNGQTAASSSTNSHSREEKFNDKSKHDDGSGPPESQVSVQEDPDFGDFAGFADFGAAFGQEKSGESRDWFTGDEINTNSPRAVKTARHDNEVADFAAFPENGGSPNQENIANGSFEQENSNTIDHKRNYNNSENRNSSINGSYDMDSDDDFGDFASVEKSTGGPEGVSTDSESKTIEIQPDLERDCASMGRTTTESNVRSDGVDDNRRRKTAQCNGDITGKEVVSHCEESTVKHTSEGFPNVDKSQENAFGTKRDTNVKNVPNSLAKDDKLMALNESYVAVKQKDYGDSVSTETERENGKTENSTEVEILSINQKKESLENAVTSGNSRTFEHGSDNETLIKDDELNDDDFGEFSDFPVPPIKQTSIHDDDDEEKEEKLCDKQMPHSLVPAGDGNDSSCVQVDSVQNNDNDDEFGDFGSFDEGHDQNYKSTTDFIAVDSSTECMSTQNGNDDDDFGEFGSSTNAQNTFPPESSDDFGNFGTFKSETNDTQKVDDGKDDSEDFDISISKEKTLPNEDQSTCDFGAFNSRTKDSPNKDDDGFGESDTSCPGEKTVPREDQDDDDFGDFGSFKSRTKDSHENNDDSFGEFDTSNSGQKSLPKEDQENNDVSSFGAFDSSTKDSQKDSDMDNDFGDFGSFESNTKTDESNNSDDFASFESNTKNDQSGNSNSDRFDADFGSFEAQAKDPSDKNENENEFGDFGSFESTVKDLPEGEQRSSNVKDFHASELKDDSKVGDFRTSDSPQNSQKKKNLQIDEFGPMNSASKNINNSRESKDDYGDFSSGEGKGSSFASFPNSHSESSSKRNEVSKQRETSISYFVPGNNVIIKQVGDAISPCFISEQRHISHCHCDILSSRVQQSLESNLGLWQQLERSDKEGRILFHWTNSFSKHKKLLSLTIRPDRPPPLQGGAMLKPIVSSQFTPFGGGLPGSMLMPEPYSNLTQSSSGLGFLEPVKGPHLLEQSCTQDKMSSHQSIHPTHHEIGLPDLSFVLDNGLKPTTSKSDIKDVSDTTSEFSSLDLDFFAPSTTQSSEGKLESRGLYEEDLLGLNIFSSSSSSLDSQKSDSPKPQKTSDAKKVWQHGGVTIPLSSQESRAQLSPAAKRILDELEDLKFMSSSVLMFPLKV